MSGHGFHVHGPHDHAVEHAAHGEHGSHGGHGGGDKFASRIAVMTAVLATIGSLFSYQGGATQNDSMLFKNAAAFEAPADCWGDVGAASGPLYVSLVAAAEERGYAKGPLSLIWASSEGGRRAAAILKQWGGA